MNALVEPRPATPKAAAPRGLQLGRLTETLTAVPARGTGSARYRK